MNINKTFHSILNNKSVFQKLFVSYLLILTITLIVEVSVFLRVLHTGREQAQTLNRSPTIITMLILKMGSLMSLGYEKTILLYNAGVSMADQEAVGMTIKYATIVVATVPILCIYPFLQKYFTKGVMIGAVKE